MVAQLCLLTGLLAAGQTADRADWLLAPQLARGQELVYRGTFTEKNLSPNVLNETAYRLEVSVFVLEELPRRWQVAFLTKLTPRAGRLDDGGPGAPPASVRLEMAEVDAQGRLGARPGVGLLLPLEGPPTLECGAVVEVPAGRVGPGYSWTTLEVGRPPRLWKVAGTDVVRSTACVKVVGEQQSADWDHPRADSTGWWRRDTVWVAPQNGVAYRVEREIKRRAPARSQATYESRARYELAQRWTNPGQMCDDRCHEILQAGRFLEEALPLLAQPTAYSGQIETLLHKIDYYLGHHAEVPPYTQAVRQVQHRLEAARRGEVIPGPPVEEHAPSTPAAAGQRAPDFIATDLVSRQTVRLYHRLGQPVLLVFYNPTTEPGKNALAFARDLAACDKGVTVLALAMTDDETLVRRQHAELHLAFPVVDGRGLRVAFGVSDTPKIMLLDAEGVVRRAYTGWGPHVPGDVREELGRLTPHPGGR
jgi:peroxiredoxin